MPQTHHAPRGLSARIARHPATPGPVVDTLARHVAATGDLDLAEALAARADLPDEHLPAVAAAGAPAVNAALRAPGTTATRAARILAVAGHVYTDSIPHLPDPTGVLAKAMAPGRYVVDHARHVLAGPDPEPTARADAALTLAARRDGTGVDAHRVGGVWHDRPDLRDRLVAAAARTGPIRDRLSLLTRVAGTDLDRWEAGTAPWLAHPDQDPTRVAAHLLTHRQAALWTRAVATAHDPRHDIARALPTAPFLADAPLLRIADDTTRPLPVRLAALAACARAHAGDRIPRDLEPLALALLPHADAATADALAHACDDLLALMLLTRDDTGPDRLAAVTGAAQVSPALAAIALATHPAATPDQRRTGLAQLPTGDPLTEPRRPRSWGTTAGPLSARTAQLAAAAGRTALTAGPAAAGLTLPVRRPVARTGALLDLLVDAALTPRVHTLTPDAVTALLALEPDFTGTVADLFTAAAAIAT